jgi:hypothetical protein
MKVTLQWDKAAEKRVFKNIDDAFNNLISGAEKGVLKGAKWLRAAANNKYTPMDTTALIATSYATSVKAKEPTAEVRYIENYSVSVHEDMQKLHGAGYNLRYASQIASGLDHKRRDSEQAKFLERPLFEERFKIFEIIGYWVTL